MDIPGHSLFRNNTMKLLSRSSVYNPNSSNFPQLKPEPNRKYRLTQAMALLSIGIRLRRSPWIRYKRQSLRRDISTPNDCRHHTHIDDDLTVLSEEKQETAEQMVHILDTHDSEESPLQATENQTLWHSRHGKRTIGWKKSVRILLSCNTSHRTTPYERFYR